MIRILIVKLTSLGDLIHTMPAITDIQHNSSEVELDWLVDEQFSEIPAWHSFVNKTIAIGLRRWRRNINSRSLSEFMNCISEIRSKNYDFIVDVQGLLKSSILGSIIAKGESHGYADTSIKEKYASLFYNYKYHVPLNLHAVTRIRNLCSQVLNYSIDEAEINYGVKEQLQNKERDNYIVLIPHSSNPIKNWEEKKWIELAKLINAEGLKVKVSWGSEFEKQQATRIAQASNTEVAEKLNLNINSIGKFLAKAKAVVSLDTGFSHIAAALETPNICLCITSDPNLSGAIGKNQYSLAQANLLSAKQVWDKLSKLI